MDAQEIMTNEEVMEVAEDLVPVGSGKDLGIGIAIGGAIVTVGGLAYKYIVKPLAAKIKAKKEAKVAEATELKVVESDADETEAEK